jgi:hypothetical protein
MVNFVSGPIVAAMGTAEGVIVKARELIEAAFGRAETAEDGAAEDDADVDTAQIPALAGEATNGQPSAEG